MAAVLFVGAVVVAGWWVLRRWEASAGPARVAKAGALARRVGRVLLVVPVVVLLAAMAEGCDDPDAPDAGPGRVTCGSWRAEDCPPYPEYLVPGEGAP